MAKNCCHNYCMFYKWHFHTAWNSHKIERAMNASGSPEISSAKLIVVCVRVCEWAYEWMGVFSIGDTTRTHSNDEFENAHTHAGFTWWARPGTMDTFYDSIFRSMLGKNDDQTDWNLDKQCMCAALSRSTTSKHTIWAMRHKQKIIPWEKEQRDLWFVCYASDLSSFLSIHSDTLFATTNSISLIVYCNERGPVTCTCSTLLSSADVSAVAESGYASRGLV